MDQYKKLAESVQFTYKNKISHKHMDLHFIGVGRSAVVFRIGSTNKVLKVFYPDYHHLAKEEAMIYEELADISYFPTLYEYGSNYLVIDYISGETIFDCLVKGNPITKEMIEEVDIALSLARKQGLNPSDVHLRNLMITSDGKIKIIDVARFRQTKNCTQWKDLKKAFYLLYKKRFFPKKIPKYALNIIAALYKKSIIVSIYLK